MLWPPERNSLIGYVISKYPIFSSLLLHFVLLQLLNLLFIVNS
ncbi:unnamed protein product [Brassica rapa subsp. trilocularis]